jgi:uncharacterized protein (TIGR02677 family)
VTAVTDAAHDTLGGAVRRQRLSGPEAEQRRAVFSYLTAGAFDDYVAVMDLFTSTLLADLSAAEVSTQLAELGIDMPAELAEERCQQLVTWGNLVRSVRENRVPTIAAYHRSRARYQVSKLGGRLHRQAAEILQTADGAREVARELLARIADTLTDIGMLAANPHREVNQEALAGAVTSVFNDHRMFTSSVTDFYAYLSGVLTRYDLAGEEYARFKELLLSYVELISADVNRNSPVIADRLTNLLKMIDLVIDNLPAAPADDGGLLHMERLPGRTAAEWEQLAAWYGATEARSGPEQLRGAARQAVGQLLANAKRMVAAPGTGVSRRADMLKLAGWFATADTDSAHRLFDATFGAYPSRHLLLGSDELDVRGTATQSWWESDAVDVPMSLRERADRTARGRNARVPDPGLDRERLLAAAEERSQRRRAAARELSAAGTLNGARVSRAARAVLLDKLGPLLAAAGSGAAALESTDIDLDIVVRAAPSRGRHTVLHSDDGALRVDDVQLTVRPAPVAERTVENEGAAQ